MERKRRKSLLFGGCNVYRLSEQTLARRVGRSLEARETQGLEAVQQTDRTVLIWAANLLGKGLIADA